MATYNSDAYGTGYYIIPAYDMDREIALNADRRARDMVRKHFNVQINNDWEACTVATRYMEAMVAVVMGTSKKNMGEDSYFRFADLLTVSSSHRKNNSAEKKGSLNVVLQVGPLVDELISNPDAALNIPKGILPGDFFDLPEDDRKILENIDSITKITVASTHRISIPDKIPLIATAITYCFIVQLFIEAIQRIALSEDNMLLINFNECFDINVIKQDQDVQIMLKNGMDGKLTGKGDHITEAEEMEDDED